MASGIGIEVITYNNHARPFPVEIQMREMGICFHTLAKECRPWKFSGKIIPVLDYLESGALKGPLVMLIDGNDTIFTRYPSLEEISLLLQRYQPAELVFCSTPANWPPDNPDQVPGFVIRAADHRVLVKELAKAIRPLILKKGSLSVHDYQLAITTKIRDVYSSHNPPLTDLWLVAKKWLQSKDIPTP